MVTTTGAWWVSLANASGVHQTATQWGSWGITTWNDVLVADFDADGKSDIAGRISNGDWWVSRSNGTVLSAKLWGNWAPANTWSNATVGDFNRDGRMDIAGRNNLGEWFVSRSTGTTPANSVFATAKWGQWSTATVWSDVQIGDFNGDGRTDIAGRSSIGQWWVNRSTGTSFGATLYYGNWSTGTTWSDVRVADFNGDGRDDIIGRTSIGQWWVAETAVTASFAMKLMGTRTAPQSQWGELVIGDFNRDGRADLATRNTVTNTVWVSLWTITGNTPSFVTTNWATLPTAGSPLWRLQLSRDPVISIGSLSVVTTSTPNQFAVTTVSGVPTDRSRDNTVSLALINNAGGRFVLTNGQLRTARAMTVADQGNHTILLRAADSLGGVTNRSLTITIEAPAAASQRITDVGAALLAYHEAFAQFPFDNQTPEFLDASGKPYLSWRVQLLPFIGYGDLYKQFHQNEAWNSPHNFALLNQMPDVYRTRGLAPGSNMTGMMMFQGAGAFNIGVSGGPAIANATDGIQHTPLFIETLAENAKFWTQPDDIAFVPANPLGSLAKPSDRFLIGMVDGSVKELNPTVTPTNAAALISWSGHEVLSASQYQNIYKNWDAQDDAQKSRDKLITLVLGLHNLHDVYDSWALPRMTHTVANPRLDANGKPLLSWRVQILPYLGYIDLYNQFRQNEPWDSPHNIQLLDKMPEELRSRGLAPGSTNTGFQIPMGASAFQPLIQNNGANVDIRGPSIRFSPQDGLANTIGVIETLADKAVPWTKWDDIDFDPASPMADIGTIPTGGLRVSMIDGSLRTVRPTATPSSFSQFVTWKASSNGEEPAFGNAETTNVFFDGQQVDDAVASKLKLRELGGAFYGYHDTYNSFPVSTYYGFDGTTPKPNLSWRVHLLPYLGHDALFNQFHLDEPWNSPHNMTLLDKMPEVFRSRGLPSDSHLTSIKVFEDETAYHYQLTGDTPAGLRGPRASSAIDGQGNTILAIELMPDQAIEWTRPDDIDFDPVNPLAGIGTIPVEGLRVLMADGRYATLNPAVSPENLKAFVTWNGGELASHYAVTSNVFLDWQTDRLSAPRRQSQISPLQSQVFEDVKSLSTRRNKLRQILNAMHDSHGSHGFSPVYFFSGLQDPTVWDQGGEPRSPYLSWRVELLPYIGETALYNQFHQHEPWNSPHNIQLLDKMPEIYRSRGLSAESHKTGFQFFRSPQAWKYSYLATTVGVGYRDYVLKSNGIPDANDGTSNTIGVMETMPENAVDWTNPEGDIFWDSLDPLRDLVIPPDYFLAAMLDGSIRTLHPSMNANQFKSLITWNGGEIIAPL